MFKITLTICALLCTVSLVAQTGVVKGRVASKETNEPIEEATTFLIGATRLSTFTDKDGAFEFKQVPEGKFEVVVWRIGFQTEKREIVVRANQTTRVEISLTQKGLRVAEIVVTAKEETRGSELGTTSRIERSAIEHVQPFSLADILQLAPGQLAENPNLQSPRQVLLRQVPTNAEGAFMNAFGTAIVLDDAPVSNNANLQSDVTILNSPPTAQLPFSSVVGRGLDLRQIATNNIESVEIIRGIPSARHGDLTAGAIVVQTRASAFPLQTRARLNPNIFETAIGQGFTFRNQKTALAFDLNYLESLDDPRRVEEQFNRITGQLTWSERWTSALNSNLRLSFFSTVDERQRYPEDAQFEREQFSRERGFRYNGNLIWKFGKVQASKVELVSSVTYTQQRAAFQEKLSRNGPVALGIGTSDTTMQGIYGAAEYLNQIGRAHV
jgi:outer membrane receptor protein involved in Fe transport